MSQRVARRLGACVLLTIGGWHAASAGEDERQPTKVRPPAAETGAPQAQATEHRTGPAEPTTGPTAGERVIMRYPDVNPYYYENPRAVRFHHDLQTFYLPHGTILEFDPVSAEWGLQGAYLARRDEDRRRLLKLYNFRDMRDRKERLLNQHEQTLRSGLLSLRAGDMQRAIAMLTLAAKLNQGDPAARVHLAQARLASGHYEDAARALRRAFQLQPKLIYLDLELDSYYQHAGSLARYTAALRAWLGEHRSSTEVHFLLGYLQFQLGEYDAAHSSFLRVAGASPRDELTRSFLSVTKPAGE